jgi:hypothetical protein
MQRRRREEPPPSNSPKEGTIVVSEQFWEELSKADLERVCAFSLAELSVSKTLCLKFLNKKIHVNLADRSLWEGESRIHYPLLELLVLVYLINVRSDPVKNDLISVSELKDAHFFTGPHVLKTAPLVERFGNDPEGFKRAAVSIGGKPEAFADASFRFNPFPKIPICYLLWEGDEMFPPELTVLFDRSIENHLPADAVWGVINLLSDALLMAG